MIPKKSELISASASEISSGRYLAPLADQGKGHGNSKREVTSIYPLILETFAAMLQSFGDSIFGKDCASLHRIMAVKFEGKSALNLLKTTRNDPYRK